MSKTVVEREIGGRTLRFETGQVAKLAAGAVMAYYADTCVLATCVRANPRPGIDFFPMQCDYREKTSAAGRFPGGFRKREGAPNEKEVLTMRMMDRPMRPLFPDGFMHQTLLDEDAEHLVPLSENGFGLMPTKDGGIALAAGNPVQRIGLLTAIDQLPLLADARFNTDDKLRENYDEFRAILLVEFAKFDTEELLRILEENDVPAAKYHDYEDVLNHPQYVANATIDEFKHPIMGNMRRIKSPAQFNGQRLVPASNAPAHGQHTRNVLMEMGRTGREVDELIEKGIAKEQDS